MGSCRLRKMPLFEIGSLHIDLCEKIMSQIGGQLRTTLRKVTRRLLAVVFLFSGCSKVVSPAQAVLFVQSVANLAEPHTLVIIYSVSVFEILLGILLMIDGGFHGSSAFLASVLLLSFTVFLVLIPSEGIDCGCFGSFQLFGSIQSSIVRNLVLLGAAMFVFHDECESPDEECE